MFLAYVSDNARARVRVCTRVHGYFTDSQFAIMQICLKSISFIKADDLTLRDNIKYTLQSILKYNISSAKVEARRK